MPSLQGRLTITSKSWEVNGRTTACAGPVSALAGIWLKANETEISAAPVDPCGLAKTLLWITYLCVYIFQLCFVWTVDQAVQQQPALTLIRQDSTLAVSDVPHVLELTKQDTTHTEELSELEVSIKTAERIRSVTHAVLWFISVILWSPTSLPVKLHQPSFLATTRRSHRQLHGLQSSSLDLLKMCRVVSFKNFENSLTTVKVMTKTKVAPFYLGHGVLYIGWADRAGNLIQYLLDCANIWWGSYELNSSFLSLCTISYNKNCPTEFWWNGLEFATNVCCPVQTDVPAWSPAA